MTITTTAVDVTYSPDGATTVFALPFAFADADHVVVELDGEVLASGYSISGAGDEDGGTLTFEDAPAAGTGTLYAYRETPLTQEIAPVNNSTVFAPVLGRGLDLSVLRDQEIAARVETKLDAPLTLSPGEFLAVDADGNVVTSTGTGADDGLRVDLTNGTGASLVGFDRDLTGSVALPLATIFRTLPKTPYEFGYESGDPTTAINAMLATGGVCKLPGGLWAATGRLLMTQDKTELLFDAEAILQGDPWTYPGGQSPFGGFVLVTGAHCAVVGAGMGQSLINLTGGSEANGIQFLHVEGGYAGYITVDGGKADGTAITDDTFQTGVSVIKEIGGGVDNEPANILIESVECRNFVQYGAQAYGTLSKSTWKDCWLHSNGVIGEAESVGAGLTFTRGMREIKAINNRIENNKGSGIFGSSAGQDSYDVLYEGNTIRDNGGWGISWTEESNFASVSGQGLNGLTAVNNEIYGNDTGGEKYGTYDSVGYVKNVTSANNVRDNSGFGVLVQTNNHVSDRTSNVTINGRITGNTNYGVAIGTNIDGTVRWNTERVTNNTPANVLNTGVSANATLVDAVVATGPTALAAQFTLTGWGSTASVTVAAGNDQCVRFSITSAGTGQAALPTIAFNFSRPFAVAPMLASAQRCGGDQNSEGKWFSGSTTPTGWEYRWDGTPVAGQTYFWTVTVL